MITAWEQHEGLPDWRRTFILMPNSKFEYDLQTAIVDLYMKYDMTELEDIISYVTKFDYNADIEYIKEVVKLIVKNKDSVPSAINKTIRTELEDEYPEEYQEVESDDYMDTAEVEGSDEDVEDDASAVTNDEELARQLVADPLPIFETLNSYVLQVARGIDTALLITGQGGVGKSYNVNRILSAFGTKGKDFVIMKGQSTVPAMYKFLYENYNKIVVFDDCDAILEDTVGLNILKGALDSGDVREISWNTKGADMVDTFGCENHQEIEARLEEWSAAHKGKAGTPNYFQFQGACIFISNKTPEEIAKLDAAILTRCNSLDVKRLYHKVCPVKNG